MADEDEDFEFQLRQQQLHSQAVDQQPEEGQSSATYTDPNDGTEYEWDPEKRAWFPKASRLACSYIPTFQRVTYNLSPFYVLD